MVARVLVLEDELVLRNSMVRGLSKLPNVVVDGAGTLDEALAAIDAAAPDLILSDLDLPHRSGIELVGELAARRMAIPIVYISAYLKAYGSQIPPNACVKVLEKPVELRELRALVLQHVGESSGAEEAATPFGLVDYIQLAAMGGHSVRIALVDEAGSEGEVILHAGQIWRAEDEDGAGREALFRMLACKASSLGCRTLTEPPGVRDIEGRWEELLLEAARLFDESHRTGEADPDAPDDLGTEALCRSNGSEESLCAFDVAMEQGLEAMLAKDYVGALTAFETAQSLQPENRTVAANLSRLRDMGVDRQPRGNDSE